jgi:MerR family transcriptional regulator, copper efflux regulator
MRIGVVTKLFGVTASKVRFLEAQGLLHPGRTPSGYRHYNETAVERLSFILQAQSFGFTIEELRRFFAEGGTGASRCELVIEHMTKKLDELGRNIDRACATRDRLIGGISDAKARLQHSTKTTVRPGRSI